MIEKDDILHMVHDGLSAMIQDFMDNLVANNVTSIEEAMEVLEPPAHQMHALFSMAVDLARDEARMERYKFIDELVRSLAEDGRDEAMRWIGVIKQAEFRRAFDGDGQLTHSSLAVRGLNQENDEVPPNDFLIHHMNQVIPEMDWPDDVREHIDKLMEQHSNGVRTSMRSVDDDFTTAVDRVSDRTDAEVAKMRDEMDRIFGTYTEGGEE
jgi:hypothetical protein